MVSEQKDSIRSSHLAVNGFYFGFQRGCGYPTTGYHHETSFIFFFVF
jgi:hypothetical protein